MKKLWLYILFSIFFNAYSQTHFWAKEVYSDSNAVITDLCVDSLGNTYIVGTFKDSLIIEKSKLVRRSTACNNDVFVAKFDKNGKLKWQKSFYLRKSKNNTISSLNLNSVKHISNNKFLLLGFIGCDDGTLILSDNDSMINLTWGNFIFSLNFDSLGNMSNKLIILKGGYYNYKFRDLITFDKNKNIFFTFMSDYYSSTTIFSQNDSVKINPKFDAPYIVKYSPDFKNILWYKDISDSGSSHSSVLIPNNITTDNNNNIYITMCFYGKHLEINKKIFHFSKDKTVKGFLVVLNSYGEYIYTDMINSDTSQYDNLVGIEASDTNHIYFSGYVQDSILLGGKCYKSSNPKSKGEAFPYIGLMSLSNGAKWINFTTEKDSFLYYYDKKYYYLNTIFNNENNLVFDKGGNIYSSFQHYYNGLSIGGLSDSTLPRHTAGFAKFDSLGNALWLRTTMGITDIESVKQNIIYSGLYQNSIKINPFTLKYSKFTSSFIAKTNDYSITRGKVKQGPYCAGDSIIIPYTKYGDYDTSNYFIAELSDDNGSFLYNFIELGRIKTNKDSTVIGVLPYFKVSSSANYRIRIRSTNPPVQSYYQFDKLRLLIYSRDKADPGGDETICRGDTIKLNTWGGTKWTWSPAYKMNDSTLRQPLVCPDTTITYRIVIADSSGCGQPDTAFKKIIVRPIPRAIPDFNDSAICTNGFIKIPVNFKYGDSLNYSWKWFLVNSPKSYFPMGGGKGKLSDTLGVYTSVDNSYSQKFAVVLTDNCTAKSDTAIVTISQRPKVYIISNFKDTSLCSGNALKYKAQAQGGIKKYYRFEWRDLNKNTVLSNSDSLIFTSDETLKIRLTVNDGCTELGDTLEFKVAVKPKLKISTNLRDTSLCSNQNLTAKAKGTGGTGNNYNFIWILDNKTIANTEQANINFDSTNEGIHNLEIILSDNCTKPDDTLKLKITVLPSPKADFTYGVACSRTKTDFVFSGKKITNTTFEWDFNGESKAYTQDAKFMFSSGEKTVKLVAKSDFCSDTIIKIVTIKKQSKAEYSAADVCENDSAVFINSSLDADSYFWKFGDGKNVETISPLARQAHKYEIPKTTTFLVKLIAKSGCSDSVTNAITINKNPNATFTFTQNGDKLNLNATEGFAQYKWKFNTSDSLITTTENYVHTLKNWSPIKVCLTVTDINNCTSETCQTIPVGISNFSQSKGFKIYPNPNFGIFTLETINQTKPEIQVFDVLGKQISFTSNQISQNSTSIQIHATQGIYFIKVNFNGKIWVERIILN